MSESDRIERLEREVKELREDIRRLERHLTQVQTHAATELEAYALGMSESDDRLDRERDRDVPSEIEDAFVGFAARLEALVKRAVAEGIRNARGRVKRHE
jgi:uncharacterized membrane protein